MRDWRIIPVTVVSVRLSIRRLNDWVGYLRESMRFRVRFKGRQRRCLCLLLSLSGCIYCGRLLAAETCIQSPECWLEVFLCNVVQWALNACSPQVVVKCWLGFVYFGMQVHVILEPASWGAAMDTERPPSSSKNGLGNLPGVWYKTRRFCRDNPAFPLFNSFLCVTAWHLKGDCSESHGLKSAIL